MNKRYPIFAMIFLCFLLFSCQMTRENYSRPSLEPLFDHAQKKTDVQPKKVVTKQNYQPSISHYENLSDYGEPNLKILVDHLNDSAYQAHILQLGDSHTAADFFSGKMRELFQKQYGNAGIGFVPPVSIPGQRTANINRKSDKNDWALYTSRSDQRDNFTLGGYVAYPMSAGSIVILQPYVEKKDRFYLQVLYQSDDQNTLSIVSPNKANINLVNTKGEWFFSKPMLTKLPAEVSLTKNGNIYIAGWLIVNTQPGVIFSTLGINGATIGMFDKWRDWQKPLELLAPDMVILAYGTNSALDDRLNINDYKKSLTKIVKDIRQAMPETVILIVGPADVMNKKTKAPLSQLDAIIKAQKEVAQKEHTLFWDWRGFMGGKGSMKSWVSRKLARSDYIHFTAEGYNRAGVGLYDQLQHLFDKVKK